MASNLSFGSSSESGESHFAASMTEHDSAYSSPSSSVNQMFSPQNNALGLSSVLCRLCNGLFTSPKVLPCLHTFCSLCLEVYIKDAESQRCPVCKSEFTVPKNGVSGLPPDYAVINIMKTFPGKFMCHSCKKQSSLAVAKCLNCDKVMCHSCFSSHNLLECSDWGRGEEEREGATNEGVSTNVECLYHCGEEVNQFCFYCNEPVCNSCDHGSEGHRCEPLSDVGDTLLNMVSKLAYDCRNKVNQVVDAVQFTEHSLVKLYNQYKESERRINETFNDYHLMLTKHRENQLSHLEVTYLNLQKRLIDMNKVSKESCEKLSHISDFCFRLLKYASVPQSLMFKSRLESRSKQFAETTPQRVTCNIQFLSNVKAIYDAIINTFGYVASQVEVNGVLQLPLVNTSNNNKNMDGLNKIAEQILSMNLNDLSIPDSSLIPSNRKFNQRPFNIMDEIHCSSLLNLDLLPGPKLSLPMKSVIPRHQMSYTWKFGAFGKMEGQFSEPNGVALNKDDDIIIADTNNNRVQLFNRGGRFKFHFGCLPNSDGQLLFPNRVAVTPGGDIVVTERAPTHQIQIYNQYGQFVRKFGSDVLQFPRAVAVDKNNFIIIVECKIMRVVIFDQYGKLMHKFQCGHNLQFPNSVAVHNNEIYISDNRSHCVMVYDYNGNFLRQIGYEGLTNYPIGVLVSGEGHILIADNHNNFNLTVFSPDGTLLTAYESKVKHSQCFDVAISRTGVLALTCRDYNVYLYQYPI